MAASRNPRGIFPQATAFGGFCAVLLAMALGLLGTRAVAAEAGDPAASKGETGASVKTLEDLAAAIEDPERRGRLVAEIRALVAALEKETPAAAEEAPGLFGGLLGFFGKFSGEMRQTAVDLVEQAGRLPDKLRDLGARLREPEALEAFAVQGLIFGGAVLGSVVAALLIWLLLSKRRGAILRVDGPPPLTRRIVRATALLFLDLLPPATLVFVALLVMSLTAAESTTRLMALAVAWALALARTSAAAVRFFLAPGAPPLRLVPMEDARASALAGSLSRILVLGVYGYFAIQVLAAAGLDAALIRPLRSLYGLALLASGVVLVLKERGKVREGLAALAARPSEGEARWGAWRSLLVSVLGLWWLAAIVYMVGLYLVWASAVEGGFSFLLKASALTGLAVAGGALFLSLGRWTVDRLWGMTEPLGVRYPELGARLPQYKRGLRAAVDVAVFVLAGGLALQAWGLSILSALESKAVQEMVSSVIGILVILLLAAATVDVATVFSQRYLEARERAGKASAKVRTLVPLTRKAIRTVVVIVAGIMVLDQAGIQIAPILAGVGILGLAVGFGAQTLVKDVITGFFILLEDTINVGDVVMLNGTGGLVEGIGIRTVRLRDLSGNVHTIPYGSVGAVTNMTKDFSMYLVEAGVAYREDVDEVITVLEEIDEGMRKDPEFGRDILKPIEILGLDRFEESAVIVRARLMTKPIQQWRIGREFNRRMKKAFDEKGIEIPFPHRTIYFGELKDGSAPPLRFRADGGERPREDAGAGAPAPGGGRREG